MTGTERLGVPAGVAGEGEEACGIVTVLGKGGDADRDGKGKGGSNAGFGDGASERFDDDSRGVGKRRAGQNGDERVGLVESSDEIAGAESRRDGVREPAEQGIGDRGALDFADDVELIGDDVQESQRLSATLGAGKQQGQRVD